MFTLPSSLQTVQGSMMVEAGVSSTTSFIAPNVKTIGYGNATEQGGGDCVLGFDSSGVTNVSFPALTSVSGGFTYIVNPMVTDVTGFPLLAQIEASDDEAGSALYINGSFNVLQLPDLTFVNGSIWIQSSSSSFRCPSNITPKIVPSSDCISCGVATGPLPSLASTCNGGAGPTKTAVGGIPTGVTASITGAASAKATGAKTSDAFALRRSGI